MPQKNPIMQSENPIMQFENWIMQFFCAIMPQFGSAVCADLLNFAVGNGAHSGNRRQ